MSDEPNAIERIKAEVDADPERRAKVDALKDDLRDELTDDEFEPLAHIGVWHTSLVVPCGPDNNTMRPLTKDELGQVADAMRELTRRKLEQRFHSDPTATSEARQAATSKTAKKIDIETRRVERRRQETSEPEQVTADDVAEHQRPDDKLAAAHARLEAAKKRRIDPSAMRVDVTDLIDETKRTLEALRDYRKKLDDDE